MRVTASRTRLAHAVGLLAAVALFAGAAVARADGPPVRQPVTRSVIPLPNGVTGLRTESCTWLRDGSEVMCPFQFGDGSVDVGVIDPDGTGFRCLTCDARLDGTAGYLYAFADGKRFFYATLPEGTANASGGTSVTPHVAECTPSIANCASVAISDVSLPTIPGDLNDREPRISPDGRHYLWTIVRSDGFLILMGDLARTSAGYEVSGVRVLTPAPLPQTAAEWSVRNAFNEGKSFDRGDRLIFASTRGGGRNLDDYAVDLRTGAVTRLTHNLEWDEDAQFDPTSRYMIIGSARHMHNQLRASALADTPSFMDAAVIAAVSPASLATDTMRLHTLEKWLTTPEEEAAGGDGEMLNDKTGGWAAGAAKSPWSPDGTQAAWGERGPDGVTRLVLVKFPLLPRQDPVCANPDSDPGCQAPTPSWAPPIETYAPIPPGAYLIPGPHGGRAVYTFGGTILGPALSVRYDGYTTDDGRILDGTAAVSGVSRGGATQTISADVAISGTHTGHEGAQVTAKGQLVCGTVESTVDGRTLRTQVGQWNPQCGFVTPEMCPDGADADATETGDCSQDGLPNRWLAPEWDGRQ